MRSVRDYPLCEKLDQSGKFQVSSSDEHIFLISSDPRVELTTWSGALFQNLRVSHPVKRSLPFKCTPYSIQLPLLDPIQSQTNHLFHIPHYLNKQMFNFTIYALVCKKN